MTRHVPCVVTADLGGPVSLVRPIHLDGLMLAARLRVEGPSSFGAPLAALRDDDGLPRASASFLVAAGPGGVSRGLETQVRRFSALRGDFDALDARGGRVSIGEMSPYRSQLPQSARVVGVGHLVWHAVLDPDAARALLAEVRFVGASNNAGVGRVEEWHVDEAGDADPDAFGWFHGGRPVRRLPTDLVGRRLGGVPTGLERRVMRPVAPYHATDGAVDCVEPRLSEMTRQRHELASLS